MVLSDKDEGKGGPRRAASECGPKCGAPGTLAALRYETLFEALPSPYMVLDPELRYVAVNAAYEEVVMQGRSSLIGRRLFDLFPNEGESGRRLRASFDHVFRSGENDTIAFIRYEIPSADGAGMEERYWTATHTPILGEDGSVAFVIQNTVDVTEMARLKQANSLPFRTIPGELALLKHAQQVEEAYQETVSESAEFRRLFRQAPGMIAVLEGPDHVFTFVNDSYTRFIGERDLIGRPIGEALPEFADQGFFEMLDEAYAKGRSFHGEAIPAAVRRLPEGPLEESFVDFTFNPIRDAAGEISGVFVQGADRTEFMRAVERQRHLIDELNHRVKNTLSTVQSLARQSFRNLRDAEDARYAFESRIMALSQAHNVLSARRWEAAGLSVLLQHELSGLDPKRVRASGPEVHVTAKAAIALAMVFHELASNALRFGAMADDIGRLTVRWDVARQGRDRRLSMTWQESVPSTAGAELDEGFGIRMLRRIIEGELGGDLTLELTRTGLLCRFDVALAEVEDVASSAA